MASVNIQNEEQDVTIVTGRVGPRPPNPPVDPVLPGDISESIAISGVLSNGGQSSRLSNLNFSNALSNVNLSQQNAVSMQQALNQLTSTATGKAVNLIGNLSSLEAVATTKLNTGNDLGQQILDLKAAVTAIPGVKKA